MMESIQVLEGNSTFQDIHCVLRKNGLNYKSIGLPVPNKPILIKPVHNVNEEGGRGANTVSYTHLDVYKRQI